MKKKLIVAGAAAALSAAAAVPALALENEFHGSYKLKYFVSNYENGGGTFLAPVKSATAANYFEQRARLFYTAKANDSLKLVTGFEIDSVFGDRQQGGIDNSAANAGQVAPGTAFRNSGGALDSDAVNLETKWVYLNFDIPSTPVNVRAGIQDYKDPFKGIFLDADLAGIYTKSKVGDATIGVGYFRPYELLNLSTRGANAPRGTDNFDIAVLEGKYNLSKDLAVGGAYFLYSDYRTKPVTFHTFGVNAEAKVGPATISGFAAYQAGFAKINTFGLNATKGSTINAFAANVAGKMKAGPGTAKAAFLYTSGDQDTADGVDHSWQAGQYTSYGTFTAPALNPYSAASPAVNTYNESGMMLLNRNAAAGGTTTDLALQYTTNNKAQGSVIAAFGYDAAITPKFYVNTNVGFGLTAENNQNTAVDKATTKANGSHWQGTEINVETGYKMYDNLTASIQAAYLFLGPYYKNVATTADDVTNPYTARVALTYAF